VHCESKDSHDATSRLVEDVQVVRELLAK
jgi:hypothetical protein